MEDYRIRGKVFIALILVVLSILGMRLVQLQIVDASAYTGESRNNAIREVRVLPSRGIIYDREGRLMVDNEPTYTVTLTPRYFDLERVGLLAGLLGVADSVVVRKLKEAREWSAFKASPAFREVPFPVLSRIQEMRARLPGVSFDVVPKRRYRSNARAAHALGYVREITRDELAAGYEGSYVPGDLIGQAGLERHYEAALRGELGSEYKLVNVHGLEVKSYLDGASDVAPRSGFDLHLALDSEVQAMAESLFVNKRGAVVALDPQTGGLISFMSKPDYDPDVFSKTVPTTMWKYLTQSEDKPMFNRATMSGMPPGSTWKPFMSLMALSEGIISERSIIECRGGYLLGNRVFHDHAGEVHGPLRIRQAIQKSCNSFFFTVMMNTDLDTFHRWANLLGFGQRIPMDIDEQAPGLIPDSAYYDRTYPDGWTSGFTINLGIGQGDMIVTPMQLARYVAAIANRGTLVSPHLVDRLVNPETGEVRYPELPPAERIPITPHVIQIVRDGMQMVMEAGTGARVRIPGIASAGKTGTAQAPGDREDHSLFIMFAPVEQPRIALAVLVENGGFGAAQAAPIASLLAERYLTGKVAANRRWLIQYILTKKSEALSD